MFYECGGLPLQKLISPEQKKISVFVGSEGGFSKSEAERAEAAGLCLATLETVFCGVRPRQLPEFPLL